MQYPSSPIRYYLLVFLAPDIELDMPALRRRALNLIWIVAPAVVLFCQIPWALAARRQGWPEINLRQMDKLGLYSGVFVSIVFANLPDFVSIYLYFKMLLYFRKQAPLVQEQQVGEQQQQLQQMQQHEEEIPRIQDQERHRHEDPFAVEDNLGVGVFMGPEELEEAGVGIADANPVFPEDNLPPDGPNNEPAEHSSEHHAASVLSKLRIHVLLSLVDMFTTFVIVALPAPLDKALVFVYLKLCFWIPIAVIRSNLSPHLKGVCTYIARMICQNEVGIFQM